MVIWTIALAILVSVGYSVENLSPLSAFSLYFRLKIQYMVVIVTEGVTDTVFAILPAYLCRCLQINITFKLQVPGVVALRPPLLLLAGFFYKYWTAPLGSDRMDVAHEQRPSSFSKPSCMPLS